MTTRVISRRGVVRATLGSIAALSAGCRDATAAMQENSLMKIAVEMDGQRLTATLFDNPSARDFATLLPLELTLQDYASVEKIAYLPRKLTTEGSGPFGREAIGDIAYYAPWGNIVFFYGSYRYSSGLIRLGRLDGEVAPPVRDDRFTIRIVPLR